MSLLPRLLTLFICLFLTGCATASTGANANRKAAAVFPIEKGVNLAHWLSQSKDFGDARAAKFTEEDFRQIAKLGFDHVRFPVDEEHLWKTDGTRDEKGFAHLHDGIRWSFKHKLRVIVDLHVLRSHHFNQAKTRTLWSDPKEQAKMVDMWRQLSLELRKYPRDRVAYEIMNEPAAENTEDWNKLMNRAIVEIRKAEPTRILVLGSRFGNQVKTFSELAIPRGDPNLILSFHFYSPLLVTHYKAPWSKSGKYSGPIAYPGRTVDPKEYENITDPATLQSVKNRNGTFDRDSMAREILPVIELGKKLGLRVHCGEFGCYGEAPLAMRQLWYRDIMSIFREYDIAWSHWEWKGGFALVNKDLRPKGGFVEILMNRQPTTAPAASAASSPVSAPVSAPGAPLINPSE